MRVPASQVLREAARDTHPNETFEKALGRVVRKHQGTFQEYMELVTQVRARATRDKTSLDVAAKNLVAEQ